MAVGTDPERNEGGRHPGGAWKLGDILIQCWNFYHRGESYILASWFGAEDKFSMLS